MDIPSKTKKERTPIGYARFGTKEKIYSAASDSDKSDWILFPVKRSVCADKSIVRIGKGILNPSWSYIFFNCIMALL